MKTHRKESYALASIALAALFGTASCNVLLGIDGDEYRDVAVELCGCPGVAQRFPDCQDRIRAALEAATPEDRAAWLRGVDANACAQCTSPEAVDRCIVAEPVCRPEGGACERSIDCCESNTNPGDVYCHKGRCVHEPEGCGSTFASCTDTTSCCGAINNVLGEAPEYYAVCDTRDDPSCFEACIEGGLNCPGCCARVDGAPGERTDVCIDGPDAALRFQQFIVTNDTLCDLTCVFGVDPSCPSELSCQRIRVSDADAPEVLAHLCVKPCATQVDCAAGTFCVPLSATQSICLRPGPTD